MKYKKLLSGILAGIMLLNPTFETITAYAAPEGAAMLESHSVEHANDVSLDDKEQNLQSDESSLSEVSEEDITEESLFEDTDSNENAEESLSEDRELEEGLTQEEKIEHAEYLADEISNQMEQKKYDSASYTLFTKETPLMVLNILGEDKRAEVNQKFSNESKYLLKARLIYDFIDEIIVMKSKDSLNQDDKDLLNTYLSIYNNITCDASKLKKAEKNYSDDMLLDVLKGIHGSKKGEKFHDFNTYAKFLQETTELDVTRILNLIQGLWSASPDTLEVKTKEVRSYLYSVYGFSEDEVPDKKPELKPETEETNSEETESLKKEDTSQETANPYEPKDFVSLKEFVSDKDGNVTFKVKGRGKIAIAEVTNEPQSLIFSEPGKLLLSGKTYSKKIDKERYYLGARFDTDKTYVNIRRYINDTLVSITQYPVNKPFAGITLHNNETITYEFEFTNIVLTKEKREELMGPEISISMRSDAVPYVGEKFHGQLSAWYDYSIDHFPVSFSSGILAGLSGVRLNCATHGAAYPGQYGGSRSYSYTFTVTSVNSSTGNVTGSIWATDNNNPANGSIYGYQELSGSATVYRAGVRSFTNTISHWLKGFKYGEGNNSPVNSAYRIANDVKYNVVAGNSFTMDFAKRAGIPNGIYLEKARSKGISGSWSDYKIGTSFKQPAAHVGIEYWYAPYEYKINYNLNGGTNSNSNPSSYNVLYGVTLQNPTRTGYTFAGWYEGNTRVFGINEGANASFTSAADLYSKLASRRIGDVNLTAKWTRNNYYLDLNGRLDGSNTSSISNFGTVDIYVDGVLKANDVSDFYQEIPYGSRYEIRDIRPATGKHYVGVYSGTISGVMPANNTSISLEFRTNTYTIVFDGNGSTGGTTPSINTKYDQAVTIPQNGFVKGPFEFIEWNTKPDGSGQSFKPGDKVSNLTSKDGDTIIIYAIWEEQVKVIYEGNGSTSGTRKIEQVDRSLLDTAYNYTVHKNSGYTAYAKTKHRFDGWWWDADGKYAQNNASYFRDNKTNKVTWPELMKHAAPAVKMSFRSVGFAALNEMKAANEMKTVEMYAQWDKAPTIEIPNDTDSKNLRTFYEGQTITEKDLVKTLKLKDVEDDITHKPLSARVVKIEYATGRLDNGNKLPGYTESYKNGMTSSDRLDTWFLELEKNKTVTHKVTYEVTDSAGNVTQAVGEVYVKYNQFPVIQAEDRYFTLEEANAGKITAEEILNKPLADGSLFVNDDEEGRFTTVGPNPKQVKLLDFNAEEFKNFKEGGYRKVTLHTQDTFGPNGKGKETVKQITIYVVEDGEIPDANKAKQVRFIDKKNYDKNKDVVSKAPMTESQMEARNGNGGLNVNSVWYHDADYRNVIENTFNKKDGKCYNYTMEQVNQIKAYVDQHGIGNIKEENALANFANQFLK